MTIKILTCRHVVLSFAMAALLALPACVDLTRPPQLSNGGVVGGQGAGGSASVGGTPEDVGPSSTGGTLDNAGGATGAGGGTESTGGATGSGGSSGNGGVSSSSGGTSSSSGGATGGRATGGSTTNRGGSTTNRGGNTTNGGATSSGGAAPNSGGNTTNGGATSSGGTVPNSGGNTTNGGATSSGGTAPSSGGATGSGGTAPSSGGATGAGGAKPDAATPDSGAPLVNLSLNKPVTASSQQGGKEAPRGNDGSLTTSFCPSSNALPAWWRVDLGAVHLLAKTDINFEKPTSYYKYKIDVSSDDTNWTTVVDQTANTSRNGVTLTDTFSAQARYVRITIVGISTNDWGCFWEFTVWGS